MSSNAQLEREAEQTRAELANTLHELRERISPGQLLDQGIDFAKDSGGGEFVRNLGRQMTANPLPVFLIGAGMAWLMLASGRGARSAALGEAKIKQWGRDAREGVGRTAQSVGDTVSDATQQAREWASDTQDRLQQMQDATDAASGRFKEQAGRAASSLADTASSAYAATRDKAAAASGTIGEAVSTGYDRMAENAGRAGSQVMESTSSFARQTANASRNMLQFCTSQPLVLAGLGFAIGAAVGASLPETEAEDRLMGESRDRLKDRAQEFAHEQYAKGKEAAQTAAQAIKDAAHEPIGDEAAHSNASLVPEAGASENRGQAHETEAADGRLR
jgi:hypothetical protein